MTGIGTGSNTHQIIHMVATAAVIATALLVIAADGSLTKKKTISAARGPMNSVSDLIFTVKI